MRKSFLSIIVLFCCYIFFISSLSLADYKPRINEFSIEESPQTVEIINTSSASADISGWYIDDSSGSTYFTIPEHTIIYSNSCQLFSYDFNLNKSTSDTVRLFDNTAPPTTNSALLIDSYNYKSNPGPNTSFFRSPDGSDDWVSGTSTLGQYNLTGENCIITPSLIPSIAPTESPTTPPPSIQPPTITTHPLSYDNVFISEVMVYPPSNEYEWIELYNNNDFTVDLSNWYIDDIENAGSAPKQFSVVILSKQYAVINLSSSLFNNDKDSVRLLDSSKTQKDGFEYEDPMQGNTLGKESPDVDVYCNQKPSKHSMNNSCILSINPSPYIHISEGAHSINLIVSSKPSKSSPLFYSSIPTTNRIYPNTPSVLGASNKKMVIKQPSTSLLNHLSILSVSYSFLTILSVLVKIKNGC